MFTFYHKKHVCADCVNAIVTKQILHQNGNSYYQSCDDIAIRFFTYFYNNYATLNFETAPKDYSHHFEEMSGNEPNFTKHRIERSSNKKSSLLSILS